MHDKFRPLVPVPEAMETLGGIGRTKFYDVVNAGELVKVNIGSRSFITAESLAAYLERLVSGARSDSASDSNGAGK